MIVLDDDALPRAGVSGNSFSWCSLLSLMVKIGESLRLNDARAAGRAKTER